MKRKTFYHISLALPYMTLICSGAFAFAVYVSGSGSAIFGFLDGSAQDPVLYTLGSLVLFFLVSGIVWGPLYTWMVIVLLLWSWGKKTDEIRVMYLLSPVLLGCAMGIPALLVNIPGSLVLLFSGVLHMNNMGFIVPGILQNYPVEEALAVGIIWGFMAGICLVMGYMFVGGVLLVERVMKVSGLFKEENVESKPNP